MSEATNTNSEPSNGHTDGHINGLIDGDVDPAGPEDGTGRPPVSHRSRGPFHRNTVFAVVLILLGAVLVTWAVTSSRSTGGHPVAGPTGGPSPATDSTAPPSIPARLAATLDHQAVRLVWQPATGVHLVTSYVVFRDGKKVASVTGTSYRDVRPPAGPHRYQVQAIDEAGIGSPLSPAVSVSVPAAPATTTRPTTKPTTTAPPPKLPARSTSWPTTDNTGARGQLRTVNGDVTLGRKGQVYQNVRVHGTVTVTACDVTLRNVEVDSGEPYTGDSTPDLFAIWLQESATCGVTIDHVTTLTDPAPNVYVTTSIRSARGGPVTITNSKLVGAQLGILGMSGGVIRGNYIELGANMRGDHNDAIQGDGSTGLTIDHNTLLNPTDQTSALALYTEFGHNSDIVVSDNLLAGGGYTCYCGDGATDNDGNPARAVNVDIVNNVFWRRYFADAGAFGAGRAYNPAGGGRWAGNVFMNANGTLTGQQVPQPALDGQ
jgi:hypothetical protein